MGLDERSHVPSHMFRLQGGLMSSNPRRPVMKREFKVGDHVTWNSEAGHVSGTIIKVHTKNVNYKGYTHHASEAEPLYEIKSGETEHIALHKGSALRRMND